jgi:outer membrane protein assembly factor BamD (BamD/ComL family)
MTLNCNCWEKFNTTTSTSTSMTTITTECFINGEKVTKDNSVKVIFNKLKSRQRKKDVQNAIKEKKILKKANKNWVLN